MTLKRIKVDDTVYIGEQKYIDELKRMRNIIRRENKLCNEGKETNEFLMCIDEDFYDNLQIMEFFEQIRVDK